MKQQRDDSGRAIQAPLTGTHIQIIACAGSGKTRTVACRVAHLLADGIEPESIVAFTFTEKAATELKLRIVKHSEAECGHSVLGRIGRMYVGTIHAYALRLLQTYAPRYAGYDLIEEDALPAWVARYCYAILGSRKWKGLWLRIDAFLHDADMVENEGVYPSGSDEFSRRYRSFVDTLESHRLLTFGRSIAAAVEELRRSEVKRQVHKNVRFVFVDEYQDVNPAQEQLIRGLVGPDTQLCVVGDDDQSIYQWRGSNVTIMQNLRKRYRPVLKVELGVNRRSLPSIVAVAADFAKTIKPRLQKAIDACRSEPGTAHPVRILTPLNREQEAEDIAAAIKALMKSGWHAGQIAILIRHWRQAPQILKALEARGIRSDCGGGNALFATELGYLLAAAFTIGAGWKIAYGWKQSHLPQAPRSEAQWAQQLGKLLRLSEARKSRAKAWIKAFAAEAQGDGTRPATLVGDLYRLADAIGVYNWNLETDDERLWFETFARFSQILASFEKARLSGRRVRNGNVSEFKGAQDRGKWLYQGLAHFLNGYAREASGGFTNPPDPSTPAVQVTTVHSAKGLEWPIVFLPGLEQGTFPSKKTGHTVATKVPRRLIAKRVLSRYAGTDADERRLFYVGMTRAKDLLVMSCPKRAKINKVSPSPFFGCVRSHSKTSIQPNGFGIVPATHQSETFDPPLPSLTFSELALYERCPYAYRLATEFDVATPIARDLGYGKSIHHILRRVADFTKFSGEVPGRSQLDKLFEAEFYVPFATAAGYQQMKAAARQLVDRYIADRSDDLKRVWEAERPFELHLDNAIVIGRADVILDREGGAVPTLTIVDYKTWDPKKADEAQTKSAEDQLRTYVAAARAEQLHVTDAVLHNLRDAQPNGVDISSSAINETLSRARSCAANISRGRFAASPGKRKCKACDYRAVCRHRS